jgi:hypothetical protein
MSCEGGMGYVMAECYRQRKEEKNDAKDVWSV